ncbi:ethanolamine ammonia-lyase reactivating factor EutA [Bacillaceae bacterium]
MEENVLWIMDNIELKSVGIDIGSANTQVIFSLLKLRRIGEDLSSRYVVVSRESIYRSPIVITPYLDDDTIDADSLGRMIDEAYEMAGLKPEQVDTGAVILTGEAIRRHNARAIAEMLAQRGGQFVCAAAGHHMEAMLAAYGSGAAFLSYQEGNRLLNIDIGGGTTKFAVVENGKVKETAALYIGGRLLVYDEHRRIVRLDPGARQIAQRLGIALEIGQFITAEMIEKMVAWMAEAIVAAATRDPLSREIAELFLTAPLKTEGPWDGVIFSGGVGEYVYLQEDRSYGDLGKPLGEAIRRLVDENRFSCRLLPAKECIRATVIGASEYSVQVSGNTIYISDPLLIPRKNLQVLRPPYELNGEIDPDALARSIREHFIAFDLKEGEAEVVLAFRWEGEPSYERMAAFIQGLETGLQETIRQGKPLYLVFDGDVASTIGSLLKEERKIKSEILSIDGILLQDFDFIDIGKKLYPSGVVPVTVKSFVFQI